MSRTTMYFSLLAGILRVGALASAHADVYRWVDKHGVVHYTDEWRPGATRIVTATGTASGSGGAPAASTATEDKAANQQIRQAADQRAVHTAEAKLRAERCKKAKSVYHRLIFARRLYTVGKNGQRHYMSDAQADAARVKARALVNQFCTPGGGA